MTTIQFDVVSDRLRVEPGFPVLARSGPEFGFGVVI